MPRGDLEMQRANHVHTLASLDSAKSSGSKVCSCPLPTSSPHPPRRTKGKMPTCERKAEFGKSEVIRKGTIPALLFQSSDRAGTTPVSPACRPLARPSLFGALQLCFVQFGPADARGSPALRNVSFAFFVS